MKVGELVRAEWAEDSCCLGLFLEEVLNGGRVVSADCMFELAEMSWVDCLLNPIRKPNFIPLRRY